MIVEVSSMDFLNAHHAYSEILPTLPPHIQFFLPANFESFLKQSRSGNVRYSVNTDKMLMDELNYARLKMLLSPHAKTLLRMWVIKHKPFLEVISYP